MPKIQGFANTTDTHGHAERYEAVQHADLGRTALSCSQAGFGCCRVAEGIEAHRDALRMAFAGGINLIDTRTNCADGASEALVGKVLTEGIRSGDLRREEIVDLASREATAIPRQRTSHEAVGKFFKDCAVEFAGDASISKSLEWTAGAALWIDKEGVSVAKTGGFVNTLFDAA